MWTYSTGMPRGHSVSRLVRNVNPDAAYHYRKIGTTLKPAYEPIVIIRKPSSKKLAEAGLTSGQSDLPRGAVRVRQRGT